MKIRLAADLQVDSIVDGKGIRTVIWTQGCSHNCFGCHNPSTHDFRGGQLVDVEEIKTEIKNLSFQDGVTFSGGDPMFQPKACAVLSNYIKELGMNVWVYTGFTYEELLKSENKDILEFMKYIDVLIDGKFELEHKSFDCKFKGSTNQRIIDVQKSLKLKRVMLFDLNPKRFEPEKEVIYI